MVSAASRRSRQCRNRSASACDRYARPRRRMQLSGPGLRVVRQRGKITRIKVSDISGSQLGERLTPGRFG